jgi:hypothetical protein
MELMACLANGDLEVRKPFGGHRGAIDQVGVGNMRQKGGLGLPSIIVVGTGGERAFERDMAGARIRLHITVCQQVPKPCRNG